MVLSFSFVQFLGSTSVIIDRFVCLRPATWWYHRNIELPLEAVNFFYIQQSRQVGLDVGNNVGALRSSVEGLASSLPCFSGKPSEILVSSIRFPEGLFERSSDNGYVLGLILLSNLQCDFGRQAFRNSRVFRQVSGSSVRLILGRILSNLQRDLGRPTPSFTSFTRWTVQGGVCCHGVMGMGARGFRGTPRVRTGITNLFSIIIPGTLCSQEVLRAPYTTEESA